MRAIQLFSGAPRPDRAAQNAQRYWQMPLKSIFYRQNTGSLFTLGAFSPYCLITGLDLSKHSPLALFVGRIRTNHPHHPAAAHNFAIAAHFLYRCSDFHDQTSKNN
jgi:hypothetical protein